MEYRLKASVPGMRYVEVLGKLREMEKHSSFKILKVYPEGQNYIVYASVNNDEYSDVAYTLMQLWISFVLV